MTDRQQAIRNEVMSIMREHSVEAGYGVIRVGLQSITGEICRECGVSKHEVHEAVDWLLENGYLIKNGRFTMDIGDNSYFDKYKRDPDALRRHEEPAPNQQKDKQLLKQPVPAFTGEQESHSQQSPDLQKALDDLQVRLSPVQDKEIKLQVLSQLAKYLHPSIAAVLDDIARVIRSMEAAS